jgi:hypothetical protein
MLIQPEAAGMRKLSHKHLRLFRPPKKWRTTITVGSDLEESHP